MMTAATETATTADPNTPLYRKSAGRSGPPIFFEGPPDPPGRVPDYHSPGPTTKISAEVPCIPISMSTTWP
jgi:hypothetical protein